MIRFLAADCLSLLGNAAAAVVLPWLILVRTGNAAAAGIVAAAAAAPMFLSAAVGGVLVDRIGRRRASILADLGSAASVAALPVVDAVAGLDLRWFVLLGVAGAIFDIPGLTARDAMVADVAAATSMTVERLAGLREALASVVLLIGPGAGAVLLTALGGANALWLTAATSLAAAAVTATLRLSSQESAGRRHGWWAELGEGWAVLRGDRVVSTMSVIVCLAVLIQAPLFGIVLPAHLAASSSPGWLGGVITAVAVGQLAGAGAFAAAADHVSRSVWFVGGLLLVTLGMALLAALPPEIVLTLGAALAGLGGGILAPMMVAVVSRRVPEYARGRVYGLQNAAALGAAPLGMLAAGFAVEAAGAGSTGSALAVAWVLATVIVAATPGSRELFSATVYAPADREPDPQETESC